MAEEPRREPKQEKSEPESPTEINRTSDEPLPEPKQENPEPKSPTKSDRTPFTKRLREFEEHRGKSKDRKQDRKLRGALRASFKPSYCLVKGIGDWQCGGESHRQQHRDRLSRLLFDLVRQQNWAEASGVMSVLLQGTTADKSLSGNRAKYSVALQLLNNIKGESVSSRRIQGVYELWMKKLGLLRNWSTKERFAVQLEVIVACLQRGSMDDAYQAVICVMQQRGFDSDPIANLMVGIAFYQLWYLDIPKELQLTDLDFTDTYVQPEVHNDVGMSVDFSMDNAAHEAGPSYGRRCDSNTSIAVDKAVNVKPSLQKELINVDDKVKKEPSCSSSLSHESTMESDEPSGNSDYSNYSGDLPRGSIFYSKGLPPWLLPMKLPSSDENLEEIMRMHRKLNNSHYKNALKCLRVALYSPPPIVEALQPFIQVLICLITLNLRSIEYLREYLSCCQMLLLGDQVQEAIDEIETLSHSLDTLLLLRMKASLTEHFDRGNCVRICTCFEDILKKDPTCRDSLAKLIIMHRRGEYDTRSLVDMIALHLDATHGTCDTWQELASCMLRISRCEEDRISTCTDQEPPEASYNVPEAFTKGESGKQWRLRARWWLRRHFSDGILTSDISSGDSKLLACKAAAASHIYGPRSKYVAKASEIIGQENEAYSFLQTHTINTIGFYSTLL